MRTRTLLLANAIAACLCMMLAWGCGERPRDDAEAPAAASSKMPAAPIEPPPMSEPGVAERSQAGQLPSDFPSDIPVFPGASSDQGLSVPGQGMLVTFTSVAPSSDIYAFYEEELPKRGWELEAGSTEHRIVARKDDRQAAIMIMAAGSQTEIGVSVQSR